MSTEQRRKVSGMSRLEDPSLGKMGQASYSRWNWLGEHVLLSLLGPKLAAGTIIMAVVTYYLNTGNLRALAMGLPVFLKP